MDELKLKSEDSLIESFKTFQLENEYQSLQNRINNIKEFVKKDECDKNNNERIDKVKDLIEDEYDEYDEEDYYDDEKDYSEKNVKESKNSAVDKNIVIFKYLNFFMIISFIIFLLTSTSIFINKNSDEMLEEIVETQQKAQSLYGGLPNYSGLEDGMLIQSGLLPERFIKNNHIITPYGKKLIIQPGNNNSNIEIETLVPKQFCSVLKGKVEPFGLFSKIKINGEKIEDAKCKDENDLIIDSY